MSTKRPTSSSSTATAPAAMDDASLAAEIARLRVDLGMPARATTRHTSAHSLSAELAELRRMLAALRAGQGGQR